MLERQWCRAYPALTATQALLATSKSRQNRCADHLLVHPPPNIHISNSQHRVSAMIR